ncbi:MAG: hypothetical protein WC508_04495 [Patescibacteria group bacterium]
MKFGKSDVAKVRVIYEQFPWLVEQFSEHRIVSATVQRIDEDVLKLVPVEIRSDVREEGLAHREICMPHGQWFLFSKSGKKLVQVGVEEVWLQNRPKNLFSRFWQRRFPKRDYVPGSDFSLCYNRNSVGEAIVWHDGISPHKTFYVVSEDKGELIIYKPPKDYTLEQWVEKMVQQAQKEVEAELSQVDSVA